MPEIEIREQVYLVGKMPARRQFHVVRRLTPMIKHLTPLFQNAQQMLVSDGNGAMVPMMSGISIFDGLSAVSETIAEISDADADYVIDSCLDAVKFQSNGSWAPLKAAGSPAGAGIMLPGADDLATQLRLVWEVLAYNLANFSLETLLPFQTATPNGQMA